MMESDTKVEAVPAPAVMIKVEDVGPRIEDESAICAAKQSSIVPTSSPCAAIRDVPFAGICWVMHEAMKLGYGREPGWCNLGQGQPEEGAIQGAPQRLSALHLQCTDHAYGSLCGIPELREAIATHYNRLYRRGKKQYTADNVAVAGGGRGVLARLFAALQGRVGYRVPDYTAYTDLFNYSCDRVTPVYMPTLAENGFHVLPEDLRREAEGKGDSGRKLDAMFMSNPCNPTGEIVQGRQLQEYVRIASKTGCLLALDEFYSQFIYNTETGGAGDKPVSAAEFVTDPETDPVLIIDGMTKCFRYPGWRVGWAVGPSHIVRSLSRAASAIDGGASVPAQKLSVLALQPEAADAELRALRRCFARKRAVTIARLRRMGISTMECRGSFYVWGCVKALPAPLNTGRGFFHAALTHKVVAVPGELFDVNPMSGHREETKFTQWLRFSFGPPEEQVLRGLDALESMVCEARVGLED